MRPLLLASAVGVEVYVDTRHMPPFKTHCKRGHELSPDNTYVYPYGRRCKLCMRERSGATYAITRPPRFIPDDPVVLAYAAGIVDGEGSVTIRLTKKKGESDRRYHGLAVRVTGTDERLIDWFREHFGGNVNSVGRAHIRTYYKRAYGWCVQSHHAELFLRAIRPYMIIKGEQADVAFELRATMGRGATGITPELFAKREEIRMRMKALNARGAPPEESDGD